MKNLIESKNKMSQFMAGKEGENVVMKSLKIMENIDEANQTQDRDKICRSSDMFDSDPLTNGRRPGRVSLKPTFLLWENLSYRVVQTKWQLTEGLKRKSIKKVILRPQSGEVFSGTLVAVIGPSGAGKSSLLNCLTGRRRKGISGNICVTCPGIKPQASLAYVPQKDVYFPVFTVRESLIFASKIKNHEYDDHDHDLEAEKLIKALNLEPCSQLRLSKCSGGQVKRVCIGVELISKPDILVLDEPTSGLDSTTAYQCIAVLRKLTGSSEKSPAILASVHQPNHKVLNEFDGIYLLSKNGHNLYFGPPSKIVDHFLLFGLSCPMYCNPSDFALEVASGDYGEECFVKLQEATQASNSSRAASRAGQGSETRFSLSRLLKKRQERNCHVLAQTSLLFSRDMKNMFKSSKLFWSKNILHATIAFMVSFLWNYSVGEDNGCWSNVSDLGQNHTMNASKVAAQYVTKFSRVADNSAFLFAVLIYNLMVSLITSVLSFPLQTNIVVNQIGNNWYQTGPYFVARLVSEITQLLLDLTIICSIVYHLTGQIHVFWRFAYFYAFNFLMAFICQTIGAIFGIIFNHDMVSAVFLSIASGFPVLLFAGFLVRRSGMFWCFRPLFYLSYVRYAFEGLLVTIYGFDRCPAAGEEQLNLSNESLTSNESHSILGDVLNQCNLSFAHFRTRIEGLFIFFPREAQCLATHISDETMLRALDGPIGQGEDQPSYALSYYELDDNFLHYNLIVLLAFLFFLKLTAYLFLVLKTHHSN